jgi:hypothetical protein
MLPSLQSLLQSGRANPFAHALPPFLRSELSNVKGFDQGRAPYYTHQPSSCGPDYGLTHWVAPDPAVGYGFTFGGNAAMSAPPWLQDPSHRASTVPSEGVGDFWDKSAEPEDNHLLLRPRTASYISTPNIDRACQFLQNQSRNSKAVDRYDEILFSMKTSKVTVIFIF